MTKRKLRLAWFSSLNLGSVAGPSSAAYASDLLLPLLSEQLEIDLFHDSFGAYKNFNSYHYLSCFQKHRQNPYDIFFYQVEDLKSSNFARMHLGLMPGIVWFHDFLFTTFAPEALAYSPWQKIPEALGQGSGNYQLERVVLDQKKREGPPPTRPDEPRALREATLSAMSLFSDERNHAEFLRIKGQGLASKLENLEPKSLFLPFPVKQNINPGAFEPGLIAYAGSVRIEQRAHKVLEALSKLERPYKLLWLLSAEEESKAKEMLNEFGIKNYRLEFSRSPRRWAELVAKAELALHPMFSVFGRQGPYLQISMMAGVPCVVSDFGSSFYLPSELVLKIEPGFSEANQLKAAISGFLGSDNSALRQAICAYAQEFFSSEIICKELLQVFSAYASQAKNFVSRWDAFMQSASKQMVSEIKNSSLINGEIWNELYAKSFEELGWS